MIKEHDFTTLFTLFIKKGKSKKRRKPDGSIISKSTINNYGYLLNLIAQFEEKKDKKVLIYDVRRANKRELDKVKNYWKRFYRDFGDFLYADLGYFDNYVGHNFKMVRVFFKWLNTEKGILTGEYYKNFFVPKEEISIVVLQPEQLQFLIHNKAFEESLSPKLQKIKDIFVFGCTVALRFSDLAALKKNNWEQIEGKHYIRVISKKTHTATRIKLPNYAAEILMKYKNRKTHLLPIPSNYWFNKMVKRLAETAGWVEISPKHRMRRGKPIEVFKIDRKSFQFYDHISSHSMRRTAITTMLRLGLEENLVRKISGHASGSKEFYKYVQLSQSFMDEETDKMYAKIGHKTAI